jgi:hypothetical protein
MSLEANAYLGVMQPLGTSFGIETDREFICDKAPLVFLDSLIQFNLARNTTKAQF